MTLLDSTAAEVGARETHPGTARLNGELDRTTFQPAALSAASNSPFAFSVLRGGMACADAPAWLVQQRGQA